MNARRPRLGLTQTQRLSLNTSLHAAISVLRSDAEGLTRYLEEQAADNPHLRLQMVAPLQENGCHAGRVCLPQRAEAAMLPNCPRPRPA